jgi:hypothetical protein
MAQNLGQLTDMWMVNPTMFDPTQQSNQFSQYNNAAMPWPPTYNPGLQGGPVNAATGKPIASFQQWQQQNPAGMSINSTPAAPQAAPTTFPANPLAQSIQQANWGGGGGIGNPNFGGANGALLTDMALGGGGGKTFAPQPNVSPAQLQNMTVGQYAALAAPQQAAPQASAPPNNWMAAVNALANPGNPVTPGANVPLQTGTQPAGGVNQAFLQQAGAGAGMNQGFLNALRAIQARPTQ